MPPFDPRNTLHPLHQAAIQQQMLSVQTAQGQPRMSAGGAAYPVKQTPDYSLVMVQLQGEELFPFNISASPALLQHSIKQMNDTGWLYLFNDAESVAIRSDKIVAVNIKSLTKE
jgi:hypothetical protein